MLIGRARELAGLEPFSDGSDPMDWVRPPRAARCRWRVAGAVGVHAGGGRPAHWSGLERCASIWACPVCSAIIRGSRADEIQTAVDRHIERGGSVLMLTLTLRHGKDDVLDTGMDAVALGWKALTRHRSWKAMKRQTGVNGYIRSVEVTYSPENGWHPHAHVLLFLDHQATAADASIVESTAADLWPEIVTKLGAGTPDRQHGIRVSSAGDGAGYIAKVQEHDRAGLELARGDLKSGRRGSLMPFELLDDPANERLWIEYFEGTHRRRCITWSRGLKARYGVADLTDDEVIDETEASALLWLLEADEYDRMRDRPEALTDTLERAELYAHEHEL